MRKIIVLFSLAIVTFLQIGCNQNEETSSATLDASKATNIKKGEPVMFRVNNLSDNSDVTWEVTPQEGVNINAEGSNASVLFSIAGSYSVNAAYSNEIIKTQVVVIDSIYTPAVNSLTPLANGETLTVTAVINDSSSVGKPDILLSLIFKTTTKYNCLNSFLLVNMNPVSGVISFDGVFTPDIKYCSTGEKEVSGSVTLNPDPTATTFELEIALGGKNYKGFYYVQNKQLYIYWPYSTGIIFDNAVLIPTQPART